MIEKMRSATPIIMVTVLVAFLGTIFLDWGMNRGSVQSRMNAAGKINGREIPLTYFDREVNNERQKLEQGRAQTDPYQSHLVPRQVWDREVNQFLMRDLFRKVNLGASAEEVYDYIKRNPLPGIDTVSVFMTNGAFDTSKYAAFLNDPKTYRQQPWLREVEQYTREMILPAQKLEILLSAALAPTQAEIEYEYNQENARAVFEYASVKAAGFAVDSAAITVDMISRYYAAHRDSFKTGDQIDLYVVRAPKIATPQDDEVYRQEMLEMRERILANTGVSRQESFSQEALISSDDESSAKNGGSLGPVERGAMVPQFDSAVFALPVGEISQPVKTRFGYHLIMVDKKDKTGKTEKVYARHILRTIVPTMETVDIIAEKIDSLKDRMHTDGFLAAARAAVAQDPGIVIDSTGLFSKGSMVPGIGYVSGLGRFAFGPEGSEKNAISERLENTAGVYLFAVKQRISSGTLPLANATERIRQILADSLQKEKARAYAKEWVGRISQETPLAALQQTDAMIISGKTDTVTASDFIPGIGSQSKVAAVAFALPAGKRSALIEHNGTFFVVRTLWKEPALTAAGSPQAAMISNRLAQMTRQRVYGDWYTAHKNRQKIISNIDQIYLD